MWGYLKNVTEFWQWSDVQEAKQLTFTRVPFFNIGES